MSSKLSEFVKGTSILVLSNLCLKAINFFLLPLYTSNLTPQMLGVSDSITTFTGFLFPLLTLGLDSAYSAFYFEKGDDERGKRVYTTMVGAFLVLGLIPLALIPFSRQASMALFSSVDLSPVVAVSLAAVSLNLWYTPFALELRLRNKMFLFGLVNVIASLLMIALNVLFISWMQLGEMSLILSTALVNGVQLALLIAAVHTKLIPAYFDKHLLRDMLRFSIPLVPAVVMTWVLTLSDRYMLLYFQGSESVGIYGIGSRFTNLLNVVVSAVSMAYTTFAFSSHDDDGSKRSYRLIFTVESALLLLASFSVALFGREVIAVMASSQYASAHESLRDLMFAQSIYAMTTVVGYGIYFKKKSIYSLAAVTAGACINVALNYLFIPRLGVSAAAASTLVGYVVVFIITYHFSEQLYPCDYGLARIAALGVVLYVTDAVASSYGLGAKIAIWCCACSLAVILCARPIQTDLHHITQGDGQDDSR